MSGKFALVIGNTEYVDPGLVQLTAPGHDARDFARVLTDRNLCAFDDVKVVLNELSFSVTEAIDEFFDHKKPDDLLVLYFSGHGVRDEIGSLYLGCKNTIRSRLRATAIKSDYLRDAMEQSRSKRQVIILDCCNSGAFPQGIKAELGAPMGLMSAFEGYGRYVLMASDATQFAWEGDKVIGEARDSLFTHFLVKGLEGEADLDADGKITVDDLYDYAYEQIASVTVKQTPTKSASKVEGEMVLRQITRLEDVKAVPLPADIMDEAQDMRPYLREVAVQKLERILYGRSLGMARSAVAALEKIAADENTTRRVAQIAMQALEAYHRAQQEARPTLQASEEPAAAATVIADSNPSPAGMIRAMAAEPAAPGVLRMGSAESRPDASRTAVDMPLQTPEAVLLPAVREEPTSRPRGQVRSAGPGWRKPLLWIGGIALIVAIAAIGYLGITFLLGPASLHNIRMTTDDSGRAFTNSYSFSNEFDVFADASGIAPGSLLEARWYGFNRPGTSPNTWAFIAATDYRYKFGIRYIYFKLTTFDGTNWSPGTYKVELYINSKLAGTQEFEVH